MRLRRVDVRGFRGIAACVWEPSDVSLLDGPGADDLCRMLGHVANTTRGWSDFGRAYDSEPRPAAERYVDGFTDASCVLDLAPPEHETLGFGYEIVLDHGSDGSWAVGFERITRSDDFTLVQVLLRDGTRVEYQPARRGPATMTSAPPRADAYDIAHDIPTLAAVPAVAKDPRVRPYAERLAEWSRYGAPDTSPEAPARAFSAFASSHDRLAGDGRNVAHVLYGCWGDDARAAAVRDGLRAVDARLVDLAFGVDDDGSLTTAALHADGARTPLAQLDAPALDWLLRAAVLAGRSPAVLCIVDVGGDALPAGVHAPLAALVGRAARRGAQVVLVAPSEPFATAVTMACASAGVIVSRHAL